MRPGRCHVDRGMATLGSGCTIMGDMSVQSDKEQPQEIPTGLVLFRPGTDPARKRRRQIFLAVYVAVAALIVWPIFPRFSGIHPLVLGLPFSLVWVLLALGVMFAALLWLFRHEDS